MFKWIHKAGKSRPDRRFKSVLSMAKVNGAKKAAATRKRNKKK